MGLANYACFNDYEAKLLADRTGRSLEQLAGEVKALVVTRGGEGSTIYAEGQRNGCTAGVFHRCLLYTSRCV